MMNSFLHLFQRKTNIDARYLFKGGAWLSIAHFISILATLATSYFFANYLDQSLYGNYRYLLSAAVILSLLSLSGIDVATVQAAAKKVSGFYKYSLCKSFQYGLITSLTALIGSVYYFLNDNYLLTIGFLLICLLQPLINSTNLIFSYFFGKQEFELSTKWHIARAFITTLAISFSIVMTDSVLIIFFVFLTSNLFANILPNLYTKSIFSEDIKKNEYKEYLSYAKHTSIQNIVIGAANQLDKILIFQTLGAKELASYAFATAIPDQYKGVTKIIDSLLLPRFSKYKYQTIRESIWTKTVIYFFFLSICAILYYYLAPFIFSILYPTYENSVLISQIYVLGIVFGFGSIPFTAMKASMDNRLLYKYKLVISLFQVVSLVILLNLYGLIGAVFARVAHRAFVCFYGYYLFFKK